MFVFYHKQKILVCEHKYRMSNIETGWHSSQYGLVNVLRSIGRSHHDDTAVAVGRETIPHGHEQSFDHSRRFVVVGVSRPQQGVNLVDEYYARLNFDGQREHGCGQLLRLSIPLVSQSGSVQIQKSHTSLARRSFFYHLLSRYELNFKCQIEKLIQMMIYIVGPTVFPQPGGPCNKTPLKAESKTSLLNIQMDCSE